MHTIQDDIIENEKRWAKRFEAVEDMLGLRANIQDSKKHLDFGCGFGTFPRILAEKYSTVQVYGIGIDEKKIQAGRSRYSLPNLRLIHSDKITGKYDSITSLLVLHETTNVKRTLNALYEHLEDSGTIMIYEFRRISRAKYREWFQKGRPSRDFEEEYRKHSRWSVKEFGKMCEEAGFETEVLELVGDRNLLYIGKKQGNNPRVFL